MDKQAAVVTRRQFLALAAGTGSIACATKLNGRPSPEPARLRARPGAPPAQVMAPGEHPLALATGRDGLLYVPTGLASDARAPLVVMLHGATGSARGVTTRVRAFELAEQFKVVVLAPDSRGATWDAIRTGFGPDVTFVDAALEQTFSRVAVNPARVALGGFSDGASYALSLGLANGDLFTHILAFSPGFVVPLRAHGRPAIFVSHGTEDKILPIDSTSRRLVPALKDAGYAVRYQEFTGPHTVPASIARDAFEWMSTR